MGSVSVIVAGDIMPSENNFTLFENGDSLTLYGSKIVELFSNAGYSVANLEGALTNESIIQQKDGPGIKASPKTVSGIKALGLSAVALANNHITDYLQQGCIDTVNTLARAGIDNMGLVLYEDREKLCKEKYISVSIQGHRICFYNVSETFFNRPSKNGMLGANVYDEWIVCNEIRELKLNHDFLIVIYHGGAEYFPYPTPQTRVRFHRMADCGADFITAQHTHCIGCAEWYKGSYLLYGQGNFLFARQKKYPEITKQGLVTEITLSDKGFEIKNHLVRIDGNVIEYDVSQDLSEFNTRSLLIDDEDHIIKEFQKLKVAEIMPKYLASAKGDYPLRRILNHLYPSYGQHPENTYSFAQALRNFNVLQGERRREDMYYVWKFLLGSYPQYDG